LPSHESDASAGTIAVDHGSIILMVISMSLAELKSEVDRLSPEERRQLTAYLVTRDRMLDPAFRQKLTCKIDDKSLENWVSLEEAEKRLLL